MITKKRDIRDQPVSECPSESPKGAVTIGGAEWGRDTGNALSASSGGTRGVEKRSYSGGVEATVDAIGDTVHAAWL